MKKLLLVGALMAVTVGALAQGTVNFANTKSAGANGGLGAPVLGTDGTPLAGAAYMAQLYVGATAAGSLDPVGLAVPFKSAGYFTSADPLTIPGTTVGGNIFGQVRAWAFADGATYEAALIKGGATGQSAVFEITGLGGQGPAGPPALPASLTNLKGFSLTAIPEPSTVALGLLGAVSLLAFRRKS